MTTKIFTKNDGMSTILTTLCDSLKLSLVKKLSLLFWHCDSFKEFT